VERVARAAVDRLRVTPLRLATEEPESDGTARWSATTMILVECSAEGVTGIGYSYAHAATARLIESLLAPCVLGCDAFATCAAHTRMGVAVRNQGREGIAAAAISAVDNALWDLKARLLGVSLASLLGLSRTHVPVYASGGFTSRTLPELAREFAGYRERGFRRVKLKVGRDPDGDRDRVKTVREAVGPSVQVMVDANGAYERKQALRMAEVFAEFDVVWFEEPVSSDDLEGLRLLRDRAPAGMAIAAGEYGYDAVYFERMLAAGAVDTLQVDATRCMGISGFLRADALCAAHAVPLSSHCAPTLHCQAAAGSARFTHLEYFRDHARMESLLFDGMPELSDGTLAIAVERPGLGVSVRRPEFERLRS
jgi:L-alanine-DL-glutamate epimerase-like enolase superfamily enzyme